MLAGLGIELGLVADGAAGALQEQVGAFTAGKFGLGAEVTCHLNSFYLTRSAANQSGGSRQTVGLVGQRGP
jgi:hypothetical protein